MTYAMRWTPVRLRVLRLLFNAGEPVWPVELAHSARIPYGTVYDTFRRLYDLGWAVGVTEPKSGRGPDRVLYRLTAEGRAKAPALLGEKEEGDE